MVTMIVITVLILLATAVFLYLHRKNKKESKVPEGLQVFDGSASNNLIYDSNRVMKIHGIRQVSGNFSFTVDNSGNGTVFAVPHFINPVAYLYPGPYEDRNVVININGNVVSGKANPWMELTILYGVF